MNNNQPNPICNSHYEQTEYKAKNIPCLARDCRNDAAYEIKIALVNGYGDFCANCKRYFEERNLIASCSTIDLGIGTGDFVKVYTEKEKIVIEKAQ